MNRPIFSLARDSGECFRRAAEQAGALERCDVVLFALFAVPLVKHAQLKMRQGRARILLQRFLERRDGRLVIPAVDSLLAFEEIRVALFVHRQSVELRAVHAGESLEAIEVFIRLWQLSAGISKKVFHLWHAIAHVNGERRAIFPAR